MLVTQDADPGAGDVALAAGYKTAATIYLVGALPGATYFASRGKWIIVAMCCLFVALVAKRLFDQRTGWARFMLITTPLVALFALVDPIRHGFGAAQVLSIVSSCAFTISMYLLLLRPSTTAQRLIAVLLFVLVALPANTALVVMRLR
jgi:hypothetical protein